LKFLRGMLRDRARAPAGRTPQETLFDGFPISDHVGYAFEREPRAALRGV
jgi:hypothetical protein